MGRIKSIEYFRVKPRWLFVKLCDDHGDHGWGEATLEGHTQAIEGALDEMSTRLIGYVAESVPASRERSTCSSDEDVATSSTYGRLSGD